MEEILVQLSKKSKEVMILIGFGIALFLLIDIFIFNRVYAEKIKEMDTLVSFVFLVPPAVVNNNEQYRRYILVIIIIIINNNKYIYINNA